MFWVNIPFHGIRLLRMQILVFQINVLESYLDTICFKVSYDKKCENCDN